MASGRSRSFQVVSAQQNFLALFVEGRKNT